MRQRMLEEALHVPKREASRWRHTPIDQEDLVADGNLALVRAARRYDPSLGVPFAAFATHCVRGAITDAVRACARRDHLGDGTFARVVGFSDVVLGERPEDGSVYEPPDPGPGPDETVESLETLRIVGMLPDRERIALVRTLVEGETAAEVASDLGVSSDRVYTLVHTGSRRLRRRAA
jgi:RNA polymerase sigma factor (sigma-70 family)